MLIGSITLANGLHMRTLISFYGSSHRIVWLWLRRLFKRLIDRDKRGGIDRLAYTQRIDVLIKMSV